MSGSHLRTGIIRVYLAAAFFAGTSCCFLPAFADQKTNQEPVRTTLPAGPSTHASEFMMAPTMSAEERNALYLQWGLAFAAGLTVVSGLVIWIFLNTRKEADDEGQSSDTAYSVATAPDSPPESPVVKSEASDPAAVAAAPLPTEPGTPGTPVEAASGAEKPEGA